MFSMFRQEGNDFLKLLGGNIRAWNQLERIFFSISLRKLTYFYSLVIILVSAMFVLLFRAEI